MTTMREKYADQCFNWTPKRDGWTSVQLAVESIGHGFAMLTLPLRLSSAHNALKLLRSSDSPIDTVVMERMTLDEWSIFLESKIKETEAFRQPSVQRALRALIHPGKELCDAVSEVYEASDKSREPGLSATEDAMLRIFGGCKLRAEAAK